MARAIEGASPGVADWVETAARAGYIAKGVTYLIVGGLAAEAAFGGGGATTGSKGALQTILAQEHGQVLLALVAAGLASYAAWRYIQGFVNPEDDGGFARTYAIASAILHTTLVVFAVRLLMGQASGSSGGTGGDGTDQTTASVMSWPGGRWIVGIAGLVVIGVGVRQFYRAHKETFKKRLGIPDLSHRARKWVMRSAKTGLTARGIVFSMIGFFFIVAALQADPQEARGLAGTLETLQQQPYGPWLLGFVGIGLACYGVHQFVKARYRRIG